MEENPSGIPEQLKTDENHSQLEDTEKREDNSPEENQIQSSSPTQEDINQNQEKIIFRCLQCRAPLFTNKSIIPHDSSKNRKFVGFGKRKEYANENSECTSYFVQQPPWLNALGRISDNIYCPKCHFKIGHFSWRGSQCSCGEWVKPSFQIAKSRVDSQ